MTAKDLKNALLQEAVQGKLVPQIASEGNAKDLLEEIRKEKANLVKEGKLKKENPLPDITEEDIPFDIPENWCWCRVGDIFHHNTGKAMNSSAKEINKTGSIRKFITTSNLYWNEFDFTNVKEMFFSDDELPRCTVTKGDILINEGGAYFGRTAIWNYDYDICFQNHVHRLRPFIKIEREYFYYIFYLYRNTNRMQSKGTAMPGLSSEVLHSTIIPLPPLTEQKRIVAAIEKFMPLIEEYGKKETELKAFNEQIGTLTKKAILQEAVQGKLVPQIAAEGNAKDLLKEIKKEKAKLIEEKNLKKEKPLPEITEDEIPFDIPENWCWCRLGEICTKLVDGDHNPPAGISEKTEYIMASSRNINNDKLVDLDLVRYLSKEVFEKENERTNAQEGDIFFTGVGTLGRSCIYDGKLNICFQRSVSVLHTVIYNKYLKYCLDNPIMQDFIISNSTGTAQKGFYLNQLAELLIPLPPLVEQNRIVKAIEKLLPLCEKLGE